MAGYSASSMPSAGSETSDILDRICFLDLASDVRIGLEEVFGRLASLPQPSFTKLNQAPVLLTRLMAVPTSRSPPSLEITLAEHDVELRRLERRSDLVLDDLHLDAVADGVRARLDGLRCDGCPGEPLA